MSTTRVRLAFIVFCCIFLSGRVLAERETAIPVIDKTTKQLMVNNQPYLMLGGELANSSAASSAYLNKIWPKLSAMNLNTVLVPVYWELMEPQEGKFNFDLVDTALKNARATNMKLVFLWFGSWKNSMSCYAPAWVKNDSVRFPLVENRDGKKQAILSPFSNNNLQADIRAYSALLHYLKKVDSQKTVIMVQVENEVGMLPDARDFNAEANVAYDAAVPGELISFLQQTKNADAVVNAWRKQGSLTSGSWRQVFGDSIATEEFFIAWHLARYTNAVAAAGKTIYPLPTFANAALNRAGLLPGQYPSGGPLPHLFSIWKAAAPALDILSPDFYNPNFAQWNDLYHSDENPLFVPEIKMEDSNAAKAYFAIGHYKALGFSPFSIDSALKPEDVPLGKAYRHLASIAPLISQAKINSAKENVIDGVLLDKERPSTKVVFGDIEITLKHEYTLSWSPGAKEEIWPEVGALIIRLGEKEFLFAGSGVVATFKDATQKHTLGIESIWEGNYLPAKNSTGLPTWNPGRLLNGDESHQGRHLNLPYGEFQNQRIVLYKY
jgi:beta-galactosidase GanA